MQFFIKGDKMKLGIIVYLVILILGGTFDLFPNFYFNLGDLRYFLDLGSLIISITFLTQYSI